MDASMQTVLNTFALGDHFFLNDVFNMDEDTARRTPADNTNPILWMTGHLLSARQHLLGLFGGDSEFGWATKFDDTYDPNGDYPPMAELKGAWSRISDALKSRMQRASDDEFTREIDWNLPNQDKTVRSAALFYAYHEGWHLGQIAYAKKALGMKGLVDR